ncbi:MAG: flagellar biosynthesis protein FlgL [Clostridium sp.]|nr:flagellar biosynthesis protein FlgL [Clostridium sp.]MCM1173074.1 flagellar biosynthesis protein FlgL [Clostridium sp.]MCM1209873.1 flagellar biosynthesis protein FlgL [Ruminococcus sp.]
MRINHNSLALNASDHFAKLNTNIAKSMERLSSGTKITSPADDSAGLAISTKMDAQIRGLKRASLNSNDGISVIQSAEGGLNEIHSILARMRELAIKAANDVEFEEDRDSIQEEIDSLVEEINQITDVTAFNGQKLLNGDMTRRSLSSEYSIQATYISEEVSVGIYELEVTSVATQAIYATGFTSASGTITADQAGSIHINGFSVAITEGMTATEVYSALQSHLYKIGIDVMPSADGVTEADFGTGAQVYFRAQQYGSNEKIEIEVSNDDLAAYLGVTNGASVSGTDCVASLNVTDDGFSSTATLLTDGNKINIVDRSGFNMTVEVDPDLAPAGGATATIEVLSAGTMVIQTGSNQGEQLSIDIPPLDADGLNVDNLIMYTHAHASKAVELIDEAVKKVSAIRSKLGAYENRFEDIFDNLEVQNESLTGAYSRIMDTDMAEEMTNYTQLDVLSQAAISMMQRSNERPESILQLLQ